MEVDHQRRAAGHILAELGFAVARTGDGVQGSARVIPEMWAPGTTGLRTSILATWIDHVAGLAAITAEARAGLARVEVRDGGVDDDRPAVTSTTRAITF